MAYGSIASILFLAYAYNSQLVIEVNNYFIRLNDNIISKTTTFCKLLLCL